MEKRLSLTLDETSALIEMSVCSYARSDEQAGASALTKLARLYHEFADEEKPLGRRASVERLPRAA